MILRADRRRRLLHTNTHFVPADATLVSWLMRGRGKEIRSGRGLILRRPSSRGLGSQTPDLIILFSPSCLLLSRCGCAQQMSTWLWGWELLSSVGFPPPFERACNGGLLSIVVSCIEARCHCYAMLQVYTSYSSIVAPYESTVCLARVPTSLDLDNPNEPSELTWFRSSFRPTRDLLRDLQTLFPIKRG